MPNDIFMPNDMSISKCNGSRLYRMCRLNDFKVT